jgi:hypothetical protein
VELKSAVGWLEGLIVETWVNYFELGNKVRAVADFGRLGDIDDNSPT